MGSATWVTISQLLSSLGITPSPSDSQDLRGDESPSEFIQRVRARTCYSTLRGLMTFCSVCAHFGIVSAALGCVVKGSSGQNGWLLPLGILGGVFGVIIVVACHQASLLSIDIADTLIEQSRKKNRDSFAARWRAPVGAAPLPTHASAGNQKP